ncbi:MAG: hypothetical protein AAGK09_00330 [Planctomycetota bacterium]
MVALLVLGLTPSLASDRSAATGFYTGDVRVKTRDAGTFVHLDQPLDLRKSKLLIDNADATSGLTGQVRFEGRIDKRADHSKVRFKSDSFTSPTDAAFHQISNGKLVVKTNRRKGHTLRATAKTATNSPPFIGSPGNMRIKAVAD